MEDLSWTAMALCAFGAFVLAKQHMGQRQIKQSSGGMTLRDWMAAEAEKERGDFEKWRNQLAMIVNSNLVQVKDIVLSKLEELSYDLQINDNTRPIVLKAVRRFSSLVSGIFYSLGGEMKKGRILPYHQKTEISVMCVNAIKVYFEAVDLLHQLCDAVDAKFYDDPSYRSLASRQEQFRVEFERFSAQPDSVDLLNVSSGLRWPSMRA